MEKIIKLYFEIKGIDKKTKINKDNEEEHYTQLQTYTIKNDKLVKYTLKLNRLLTKNETEKLMYQTIYIDSVNHNLKEFQIDKYTKTYSCDNFKVIDKLDSEDVFIVEKEITMEIHNIKRQEQIKKDRETEQSFLEVSYTFQSIQTIDTSIRINDIKVITDILEDFEAYKGKKLLFKDIQEMRINNKVYFRTTTKPIILD
jgi:hypothetical protein